MNGKSPGNIENMGTSLRHFGGMKRYIWILLHGEAMFSLQAFVLRLTSGIDAIPQWELKPSRGT